MPQDVPPPRVLRPGNGHVIRHDVENLPQVVLRELGGHARMRFASAEVHVHRRVIDDVVAVRASLPCLQIRRRVHVADAELGEVRCDFGGAIEPETGMQLYSVGGEDGSSLAGFFHCPAPGTTVRQ